MDTLRFTETQQLHRQEGKLNSSRGRIWSISDECGRKKFCFTKTSKRFLHRSDWLPVFSHCHWTRFTNSQCDVKQPLNIFTSTSSRSTHFSNLHRPLLHTLTTDRGGGRGGRGAAHSGNSTIDICSAHGDNTKLTTLKIC